MKVLYALSGILCLLILSPNGQTREDLSGDWLLQIQDIRHRVVATMTIRFLEEEASSCLSGNWKQVAVSSYKASDPRFFPVDEPLSYMRKKNQIFIGRNEICDAYIQLSGELEDSMVIGEYITFGWQNGKRGYFVLKRVER